MRRRFNFAAAFALALAALVGWPVQPERYGSVHGADERLHVQLHRGGNVLGLVRLLVQHPMRLAEQLRRDRGRQLQRRSR